MCNCINQIIGNVKDMYQKEHPKTILSGLAYFENSTITVPQMLFSRVLIEVKRGKGTRNEIVNIHYQFCPFCGKKIER